jgi:hypothetical protein
MEQARLFAHSRHYPSCANELIARDTQAPFQGPIL